MANRRYHVGKDGQLHVCEAEEGNCPLSGSEEAKSNPLIGTHYTSIKEGNAAIEKHNKETSKGPGRLSKSGKSTHKNSVRAVEDPIIRGALDSFRRDAIYDDSKNDHARALAARLDHDYEASVLNGFKPVQGSLNTQINAALDEKRQEALSGSHGLTRAPKDAVYVSPQGTTISMYQANGMVIPVCTVKVRDDDPLTKTEAHKIAKIVKDAGFDYGAIRVVNPDTDTSYGFSVSGNNRVTTNDSYADIEDDVMTPIMDDGYASHIMVKASSSDGSSALDDAMRNAPRNDWDAKSTLGRIRESYNEPVDDHDGFDNKISNSINQVCRDNDYGYTKTSGIGIYNGPNGAVPVASVSVRLNGALSREKAREMVEAAQDAGFEYGLVTITDYDGHRSPLTFELTPDGEIKDYGTTPDEDAITPILSNGTAVGKHEE